MRPRLRLRARGIALPLAVAAGIYFLALEQDGDKLGRKVVLAE